MDTLATGYDVGTWSGIPTVSRRSVTKRNVLLGSRLSDSVTTAEWSVPFPFFPYWKWSTRHPRRKGAILHLSLQTSSAWSLCYCCARACRVYQLVPVRTMQWPTSCFTASGSQARSFNRVTDEERSLKQIRDISILCSKFPKNLCYYFFQSSRSSKISLTKYFPTSIPFAFLVSLSSIQLSYILLARQHWEWFRNHEVLHHSI